MRSRTRAETDRGGARDGRVSTSPGAKGAGFAVQIERKPRRLTSGARSGFFARSEAARYSEEWRGGFGLRRRHSRVRPRLRACTPPRSCAARSTFLCLRGIDSRGPGTLIPRVDVNYADDIAQLKNDAAAGGRDKFGHLQDRLASGRLTCATVGERWQVSKPFDNREVTGFKRGVLGVPRTWTISFAHISN